MASSSFYKSSPSKSQSQAQLQPQVPSQRSSSAQRYHTQPISHHNSYARSASHPISPGQTRQDEKNFIAHYEERQEIVAPEKIEHDSVNKKLGFSSRKLKVTDFELMKTLGTGTFDYLNWTENDVMLNPPLGTFARVWLTRLSYPKHEDRNKVFALKVLRKVDGMFLGRRA
jgi:hypothetical protein